MTGGTDDAIATARAGQARRRADKVAPIGGRSRALRRDKAVSSVRLMAVSGVAIVLIAMGWGMVSPIGLTGVMLAALVMVAIVVFAIVRSTVPDVTAESLPTTDLKQLAGRAEIWLEQQQPLLPRPGQDRRPVDRHPAGPARPSTRHVGLRLPHRDRGAWAGG